MNQARKGMKEFKVGDMVYFPKYGTEIYQIRVNHNEFFPLAVFNPKTGKTIKPITRNGSGNICGNEPPCVFHADEDSCESLTKLYGSNFSKAISFYAKLVAHFERCGNAVLCLVSNDKSVYEQEFIVSVDEGTKSFISKNGESFYYAKPMKMEEIEQYVWLE